MNLKQHWYKWVAAVFLLYVVLGGLFLPLKPGITGLTPVKIVSGGIQTLKINVYNAPWLKENAFKDQEIDQGQL